MERLWNYYRQAAEKLGMQSDGTQAGYSMAWFYGSRGPEELNDLTRTFLGDPAAQGRLHWNETLPSEKVLRSFYLEGTSPPNPSQQKAIQVALSNPVSFLQGPPGTGKTAMILHLLSCITAMGKTAAVVSSNNTAKRNVEEKIQRLPSGADTPNQRRLKNSLAELGNAQKRREFTQIAGKAAKAHQTEIQNMGFRNQSGKLVSQFTADFRKIDSQQKIRYELGNGETQYGNREPYLTAETFLTRYPIVTSTLHSLLKCFRDGDTYQYDYVILDESSQAGILPGLAVMSCAKHLVLVGDEEQLSAFLSDLEEQKLQEIPTDGVDGRYQMVEYQMRRLRDGTIRQVKQEDKNFLTICRDVFLGRTDEVGIARGYHVEVLLNQHYRCHKGIIQFCNEAVYHNQLMIETEHVDASYNYKVKVPIRVRWFEGDYCEQTGEEAKKQNRKQIAVFLAEEWPKLAQRWHAAEQSGEKLSFCIMSPFNHQLDELEKAIQKRQACLPESQRVAIYRSGEKTPAGDGGDWSIPMLSTIHKAQGQEFDIVYLLPVEDGKWQWPWSQKKRMVNVAVSRAKRELILVVSAGLMSPQLWRALSVRFGWNPKEQIQGDDSGELFIQKLTEYTFREAERPKRMLLAEYPEQGQFGFQKSRINSIFDAIPQWREKLRRAGQPVQGADGVWATETCLAQALLQMPLFAERKLKLFQEVRVQELLPESLLEQRSGEEGTEQDQLLEWSRTDTRLDFVICAPETVPGQGDRVLLVLELDGSWHRQKDKVKDADQRKNRLMEELLHADCYLEGNRGVLQKSDAPFAFLRLPSDGTTAWETDAVREESGGAEAWEEAPFFTIEDLLREQLNRDGANACRLSLCSISAALNRMREQYGQSFVPKGIDARVLEEELQRNGYLICRKEAWVPIPGWVPTMPPESGFDRKRECGVQKGFAIGYGKGGCFPVCSKQGVAFLQTMVEAFQV